VRSADPRPWGPRFFSRENRKSQKPGSAPGFGNVYQSKDRRPQRRRSALRLRRVRWVVEMYGQAGGTGLRAPRVLPAMHAAKPEKRCGLAIDRVRWPADEKARI